VIVRNNLYIGETNKNYIIDIVDTEKIPMNSLIYEIYTYDTDCSLRYIACDLVLKDIGPYTNKPRLGDIIVSYIKRDFDRVNFGWYRVNNILPAVIKYSVYYGITEDNINALVMYRSNNNFFESISDGYYKIIAEDILDNNLPSNTILYTRKLRIVPNIEDRIEFDKNANVEVSLII